MPRLDGDRTDANLAAPGPGDDLHQVTQRPAGRDVAVHLGREGLVLRREPLEETLGVFLLQEGGMDERLDGDLLQLELKPELPGEDQRLARHVQAGQVVAG
jgi:hypothetical protein